jgi:hypothetical protein
VTSVALLRDRHDSLAAAVPVVRAAERLRLALEGRGIVVDEGRGAPEPGGGVATVSISGGSAAGAAEALARAGVDVPERSEAFAIVDHGTELPRLTACAADVRGLVYAVLELADRVELEPDPVAAIRFARPLVQEPANRVRSVARLFCSDVEDLGWYRDEGFWRRYVAMLVAQRFNRVSLSFGLGYNFHRGVTDAYLYFAYPFLVAVPGYDVRVPQLPDEERERNLEALRFASEEARAVGLDVQLGLWTHAFEWIDSPDAHQTIEGLTPDTHAAFCRDAVTTLLDACPAIGGITFRVHGEGGVPEGSWGFWRTAFDGVVASGRRVGIDLHAKGLDEPTLRAALDTGLPITVSPKFWAEHTGLPYHQAAIRENERTPREDPSHLSEWHRYMRVSEGSRPFTRYGYGDFLREDRAYDVVFRLWPGTQRLLLWGDSAFAAGYGRASNMAGSGGIEWFEPLTFKGREGTGVAGSRTGYADPSLVPSDDWEKFAYTYRLFGRLTYDPDAPAGGWRRALRHEFGDAADDAESGLANASRILPLVTVAHHPSASNNYYWPELYTDMPIITREGEEQTHPYRDTPVPRRFGTVDPLDPEVFSSVASYVEKALAEEPDARVSPMEVADLLERFARASLEHVERLDAFTASATARRWSIDIRIASALGRYFAAKLRAAVGFEIHRSTGDLRALVATARESRVASAAWTEAAKCGDAYVADLTYGPQAWLRGHWRDRLGAIDADVEALERLASGMVPSSAAPGLPDAGSRPLEGVDVWHQPTSFRHGSDHPIELRVGGPNASSVRSVHLRYRPMDHSRRYDQTGMDRDGGRFVATIPAETTSAPYPVAYAFVVAGAGGLAWRFPGLGEDLAECPYFVAGGGS